MATSNPTSAEDILQAIEGITAATPRTSYERGKKFYPIGQLGNLLEAHFSGSTRASAARAMEMSSSSLRSIYSGGDISENMLFRIQRYFEAISRSKRKDRDTFDETQQWRLANAPEVQAELARVSASLVKLCDALAASNSVGSLGSPISAIQKAQLIAMLKSMIAALEAPAVSQKQANALFRWLKKILGKGIESKVEQTVSDALSEAVAAGGELLGTLADQPGVMGLDLL